ncbi:MAG TPA: 3-dehydroquinate synthase [Fimbriimonadaceae bacterium]|nr:3-dehydroquinate synthase [Fimbriimonadaceae bacterium]HRJ95827.1 3-dehydroquinate synthase [Fimbriimonadaceae bacterium]
MTVRSSTGSYEIVFDTPDSALREIPQGAYVITDENVWAAVEPWRDRIERANCLVLPPGEQSKSIETYERCVRWLAEHRASRRSPVVALGGGVIGDLAGFAAATYMRGVPLLQIPTTLLAQVDSSVGGKVGIDLPDGKNLVGAFYPPTKVLVASGFLATLPRRELINGAAEVWKYGFIMDNALVEALEAEPIESADVEPIIRRCIELKARVVEEDEHETTGLRAILNFGHTVGHAIEKVQGYVGLKHGEAIAIGMVAEAWLSRRLGLCEESVAERVAGGLAKQGLPTAKPERVTIDALVEAMRRDKKADREGLAFSLLTGPGACKLVQNVPERDVIEVLSRCWA